MTTEYKLLLNDFCIFIPLENKKNEDVLRFEIVIKNPKNLTAYEVWNPDTPKANAGTAKIFGIAPTVLVNSINNYDRNVDNVKGFTYKPTATVVLGNIAKENPNNEGGLLVIDSFSGSWSNDDNEPILLIAAHSRHTPVLDELRPFPTEIFEGKIRMNINGFQSTSMIGVVDPQFIDGWLKPTYDKLVPYPYIGEEIKLEPEIPANDRRSPGINFEYSGPVVISQSSGGRSKITVRNPKQTLQYQVWGALTAFSNQLALYGASLVPLSNVYSVFKQYEKMVIANGLPVNEYAWRPVTTFDLVDSEGKNATYIGRIVNITSELGEPNEAPKIVFEVDTNNFELYLNKRIPALPNGDFIVIMDIDFLCVCGGI